MIFKENMKKTCGFYVSDFHFVTMLLPHIENKIENGIQIKTLLNKGIESEVKELIPRMNLNDITKARVLNLNWKSVENNEYNDIKKYMNEMIKERR